MDAKINVDIPFRLLESCDSKYPECNEHESHGPNLECRTYSNWIRHPITCMCHGSGMQPTRIGYEAIYLIRWLLMYAPFRMSELSVNSLQQVIDYISKEQARNEVRAKQMREEISQELYAKMIGDDIKSDIGDK